MVTALIQGPPTNAQFGYEEKIEEQFASVNCAASICEVNDEQEQELHDDDALFRTPRIGLLPSRSCSTCKQQYGELGATLRSESDCDACRVYGARC